VRAGGFDRLRDAAVEAALSRPWTVLMVSSGALVLLLAAALARVEIRSDLTEMIPTASARVLARIDRAFGAGRRAFILATAPEDGEERLVGFARGLKEALAASSDIELVEYGFGESASELLGKLSLPWGPLLARPEELSAVDRKLTPEGIRAAVDALARRLRLPGRSRLDELAPADPLGMQEHLRERLSPLRGAFRFHPASLHALSEDGRSLLITLVGRAPVEDLAAAKRIVRAVGEARERLLAQERFRGVEARATGGYFLSAETESVVRADVTWSVAGAVALIFLICIYSFRRVLPIAAGVVVLLSGLAAGLALTALLLGRIDTLSFGAAAILAGLGTDFSVHIVSRALARRGAGETAEGAVRGAVRDAEEGLRYTALTTAAAFSTFLLAHQSFLRQMGLLAALGMIASYAAAIAVYPAALVLILRRDRLPVPPPRLFGLPGLTAWALRAPRTALALSLGVGGLALACAAVRPPGFETDLRNIHAKDSPAIATQEAIARVFGGSAEPLAVLIEEKDEVGAVEACGRLGKRLDRLVERGAIAGWVSIAQLLPLPLEQAPALALLRRKDGPSLARALEESLDAAGFDPAAFAGPIAHLRGLAGVAGPLTAARLRELGLGHWAAQLIRAGEGEALALAAVYPQAELWTEREREETLAAVGSALRDAGVRASMAGLYTASAESAAEVGEDLARISLAAAAGVVLLVAIQFRGPRWIAAVLLPIVVGCAWMAGGFSALDLKLHFMNIPVLPMIIGIGVDTGIHIVSRYLASHGVPAGRRAEEAMAQLTAGLTLAAATNMAGFGAQALSTNQGLASIGIISLIGMGSCFLIAMTALPALLRLLEGGSRRG